MCDGIMAAMGVQARVKGVCVCGWELPHCMLCSSLHCLMPVLLPTVLLVLLLQPRLHLMGGAFNLATHASVRRFIDDPLLSYKPMLFIPEQAEAKNMVL